jgi:starch synthase
MEILFATTELAPYVKVGGLADVAAALPKALRGLDHTVTILAPRFAAFEEQGLLVARRLTPLKLALGARDVDVTVFDGRLASQVDIVLVDAAPLFEKGSLYDDDADAALRAGTFSLAIAELARQRAQSGRPFDIVHLNDWPTAVAAEHLRRMAKDTPELAATRTVLAIHNGAYQGVFPRGALGALGLTDEAFHIDGAEFFGKVSCLKLGVLRADAVVTVSPTYAAELATEVGGHGLHGVFASRKVVGILNGVDYSVWNPATDTALVARYDAMDTSGKVRCKAAFQKEMTLPIDADAPLLVCVSRITEQKGSDLVAAAIPRILKATDAQIVVCGEGDEALVQRLEAAASRSFGRAVFVRSAPEPVVHRALAAADAVLVPSRFEPCGLVQMYAQRYGAPPVVRATGGLADTVVDCDAALETGTGFVFAEDSVEDLVGATLRAVAARVSAVRWPDLVRRVMRLDRSWDGPARRYEQIYRSLASRR